MKTTALRQVRLGTGSNTCPADNAQREPAGNRRWAKRAAANAASAHLGARRAQRKLLEAIQRRFVQSRPAAASQKGAFHIGRARQQGRRTLIKLLRRRRCRQRVGGLAPAAQGRIAGRFARNDCIAAFGGTKIGRKGRQVGVGPEDHVVAATGCRRLGHESQRCGQKASRQRAERRPAPPQSRPEPVLDHAACCSVFRPRDYAGHVTTVRGSHPDRARNLKTTGMIRQRQGNVN